MMSDASQFSTATLKRVAQIARLAKSMSLDVGTPRSNVKNFGDLVFFLLSNGPDICRVMVSGDEFFVEYYWDAHRGGYDVDYYLIKNIRNFLFYLRRKKFIDFEIWDKKIADAFEDEEDDFNDLDD